MADHRPHVAGLTHKPSQGGTARPLSALWPIHNYPHTIVYTLWSQQYSPHNLVLCTMVPKVLARVNLEDGQMINIGK